MVYSRVLGTLARLLSSADNADLPLLRLISPDRKKRLMRRILRMLPSRAQQESLQINGIRLTMPGSFGSKLSVVKGNQSITELLDEHLRPGMVFVDVGANIGYHSLLTAKRVGPSGRVFAVEPAGDTLELLKENIASNGLSNITVLPYAAGAAKCTRNFYLRGEHSGQNSLYTEHFSGEVAEIITVQEVPLDDVITDKVDFVKVDVEGGEVGVINGMRRILESNPHIRLVAEWSPLLQIKAGQDIKALPALLESMGFSFSIVEKERCRRSIPELMELVPGLLENPRQAVDLYAERRVL